MKRLVSSLAGACPVTPVVKHCDLPAQGQILQQVWTPADCTHASQASHCQSS